MNLGNLAAGDVAIVVKVRSQSTGVTDQLAARGIHPGAQISVLRHGDPIAVALEETRWAMSKEHADHIEVSVIETPCLNLSVRKSQPKPARERTLADLKPGQRARVAGFAESNPLAQRIMQLGLIAGTMLTYVRAAPAGDPIEINVLGYSLSLRKSEARMILVEDVA